MIKLLEHNIEIYKRLCEVLITNNKCALVQATGTGKSYIAGKYIEEHVNTALILVPTNAIADAWTELMSEEEKDIDIITYQAFSKEPNNYLDYDLVIADEMHHLGSDVWGKKFVETYLESENHKIIGLTATEVRYLDNSRDMAEEIFENIRVDGCDLPTAINTGVLPTFKYVSALYCDESDFDEWKEKAGKISDIEVQNELKGKLDVCIKNMVSVKQAVNENLTDEYKKIIVFLNNVESKETALEMFKYVFPTANFYDVDYSKYRAENNSQIEKFKTDNNRAVLFAVDMLNEGVHIKGTDCIIMFRKTESPQIYLQQLGRGLESESEKMPIIFDFVSNTKNISARYKTDSEEGSSIIQTWNKGIEKDRQIVVKSYVTEIRNVFYEISEFVSKKAWTEEDDDFLINNYRKMRYEEIGDYLGRSKYAVVTRAGKLGLKKITKKRWRKDEEEFLRSNYEQMTYKELSNYLGENVKSVRTKCHSLGLVRERNIYSNEEIEFLKNNFNKLNICEMSKILNRTECSVEWKLKKLRLFSGRRFKDYEDEFILKNCHEMSFKNIADRLGRNACSVRQRAKLLGVSPKNRLWSAEDVEFINNNEKYMSIEEMAISLNRSKTAVSQKIRKLKKEKLK